MNVTLTHCALQNAVSSRGRIHWQANLGRNDEGTMDVRMLALSEAIYTSTDSTARVTEWVLGAGISAYTLPWSLGVPLHHGVVVRASICSSYVIFCTPRTYRVGLNHLTCFRKHFFPTMWSQGQCANRGRENVKYIQKPVRWKQASIFTYRIFNGLYVHRTSQSQISSCFDI
jgi:hypothetical protein